jgi:hypothetical protein
MRVSRPVQVELTEFEQALFEEIIFDGEPSYLRMRASGKASRQLMESLIKRKALPAARRHFFTQPFPGGRGRSHMEVFMKRSKRHVFEDPEFVKRYLRYFISGPALPPEIVEQFCGIAAAGTIGPLRSLVREVTRKAGGDNRRRTADEFYKLALECFPDDPRMAGCIRRTAMNVR